MIKMGIVWPRFNSYEQNILIILVLKHGIVGKPHDAQWTFKEFFFQLTLLKFTTFSRGRYFYANSSHVSHHDIDMK